MSYVLFKITKLKTEDDFKKVTIEKNKGSIMYYKCLDFINQQPYYTKHKIRKNGILALWLRFEYHVEDNDRDVSAENWKAVTDSWARSYVCQGNVQELHNRLSSTDTIYTYDKVFSSVDGAGKLNFATMFQNEIKWFITVTKTYVKHMNIVFGTDSAPESVLREFLRSEADTASNTNSNGTPKPKEGESVIDYYERVDAYIKDLNKKRNEKGRKNDSYKAEVEMLRLQHKTDVAKLKHYERLDDIAGQYSDFRTLRSDALAGKRIKAAYSYYESQGEKEVCDYIKTLLEYGRQVVEAREEH